MSTKLLPHEKSRKKDFGTTSYNRPGPPTPSKNGGRPSLQENEILHPQNESKTPKRTTPNRLKSLFKKRNSGVCDTSEVGLEQLILSSCKCKTLYKNLNFKYCTHPRRHHHVPLVKSPKTICIPEKKIICSKFSKIHRMKKIFKRLMSCTSNFLFLVSLVVAAQYVRSLYN